MNRFMALLTVVIIAGVIAIGCSGGSPVTPTADQEQTPELTTESNRAGSGAQTNLLGYWDVLIDPETGTVELLENRHAMFTVNLTNILSKQPTGLNFKLINIIIEPDYIDVDIDIIVTHPFSGYPGYNGYDLRGIFMGDGSLTLEKGGLKYPELGVDQYMLPDAIDGAGGPDGYTRWYNFTEFSESDFYLFSYTAGKITSPNFAGTATLCPYRYFADGLQPEEDLWNWLKTHKDQNGVFSQSVTNTRNFYIRFPTPEPGLQFSVAVIVDWEGLEPEYHPANCPEAIACEVADNSYVYYVDPSENGGNLNLDISLFGWDYQPSKIYIESTVLSAVASFDPATIATGGGDHYSTYQVDIPADNVTGIDGQELWVIAEYEGFDYTNDFGVPNLAGTDPLSAYFRYDIEVASEPLPWIEVLIPNGGEEWVVGTEREITWDSWNVPGTVFIDYSKDNFVDDIILVAIDETNDGSFTWEIPDDTSDTVRVRISSTDDPGVYDISDEDFSIVDPCDPDLDPPDTFIDYGCEDQPAHTTVITLGVSGIDPNDCTKPEDLTYEWRKAVDGGDFDEWHPDPGPELTITELSPGDWAIEVRTVDEADNKDPSPAECFFNIFDPCDPDLDPPDTFIDYGCEDQPADTTEITLGVSGI
ncbi:hypothetical protein KAU08_10220, partial [bacterium]|nr:hypothetical protein [bacterium]